MRTRQKVLVFLLGSLGDSIVAIPALRMVRQTFPHAEIVLLHQSGLGLVEPPEIIPGALVDGFIAYERGKFSLVSYLRLLPRLRRERFDAAVYLVFSERPLRSVYRDRLYFRAAGIRERFGFDPFTSAELYPVDDVGRPASVPQEAQRHVARLKNCGFRGAEQALEPPWIAPGKSELKRAKTWLRERLSSSRVLAVAPGCKTDANQWPVERFIDLLRTIRATTDVEIVIVGGLAESSVGDQICAQVGGCTNAAGKFSVREAAALLSLCDAYLGLDTGTTHLAAAIGLPVVAIYGQRNHPGQWFPIGNEVAIVEHGVPCAGCRLQTCDVVGHPCMTGVEVSVVVPPVLVALQAAIKNKPHYARETA